MTAELRKLLALPTPRWTLVGDDRRRRDRRARRRARRARQAART